jgi:cytochrome c oxidase accessory protein FixG
VATTPTSSGEVERFDVEAVNAQERRQPLYAAREKIHPKRASGDFRRLKWIIMAATLTIYYVTPWLRWERGIHAPDQAVLVDIANRRFYFFMIEIWPQEFYYVAGLLVMAGIGLLFVTSSVGRAWCGYTCPQTVWVDLFLVVERFFEGDRNARIRLDGAPFSFSKFRKRLCKHVTWLLIAVATGGAWIFYFADAPTLLRELLLGDAAMIAYATVAVLTATTYVFGGHMREQVCTYMCPWPRIQGAMQDAHSLVVTYNDWRGEPRRPRSHADRVKDQAVGDCVDCNACVAVCPMGIDIRDGQQLECITCALCIDACDGVMAKIGRGRGLISYATLADYTDNMALASADDGAVKPELARDPSSGRLNPGFKVKGLASVLRPRTFAYLGLWSLIGLAMLVALLNRGTLDLNVLHDRNPLYVQLSDGGIRNGYTVKVLNKRAGARALRLSVDGLPGAGIWTAGSTEGPTEFLMVDAGADRLATTKVFVRAEPKPSSGSRIAFRFVVTDDTTGERAEYETWFEGPEGK